MSTVFLFASIVNIAIYGLRSSCDRERLVTQNMQSIRKQCVLSRQDAVVLFYLIEKNVFFLK